MGEMNRGLQTARCREGVLLFLLGLSGSPWKSGQAVVEEDGQERVGKDLPGGSARKAGFYESTFFFFSPFPPSPLPG